MVKKCIFFVLKKKWTLRVKTKTKSKKQFLYRLFIDVIYLQKSIIITNNMICMYSKYIIDIYQFWEKWNANTDEAIRSALANAAALEWCFHCSFLAQIYFFALTKILLK